MAPPPDATAAPSLPEPPAPLDRAAFQVSLDVFEGPFDLLLSLITKRKLDITEVSLAEVTDEFISYMNTLEEWDLSQASDFLVVAATLLDLKAARLLPGGIGEDTEDLELLEARDLLFARLLQYRAFKEVAGTFAQRLREQGAWRAHPATLEPQFAALLPELVLSLGPAELASLAAAAIARPAPDDAVPTAHLHAPAVSVREQAVLIAERLRRGRTWTFRQLVEDAGSPLVVVARFLALLELYREAAVSFDQASPLGELTIHWSSEPGEHGVDTSGFDDYEGESERETASNETTDMTQSGHVVGDATDRADQPAQQGEDR